MNSYWIPIVFIFYLSACSEKTQDVEQHLSKRCEGIEEDSMVSIEGVLDELNDNKNSINCGDLLSKYGKKPNNLEFITCRKGEGQTILEATYRVSGEKSFDVEAFLVERYGLGKLKFTCCGWESEQGKNGAIQHELIRKINPNYHLLVSMYANAEIEKEDGEVYLERDRNKIEAFTVKVEIAEI